MEVSRKIREDARIMTHLDSLVERSRRSAILLEIVSLARGFVDQVLWLIEAKAGKTVQPSMSSPPILLRRALPKRSGRLIVVHRESQLPTAAIARGVEALDVGRFIQELSRGT